MNNTIVKIRTAKAIALLAACASPTAIAYAQAAPEPVAEEVAPQDQAGDIVVTGSRIVRDGSKAPTPVTVVTAAALQQAAPSNIPDALNKLPQFANSSTPASGSSFQAAGPNNRTGNFLNLRSLGTDRVLVLLNGSRVPPTHTGNAVDTNVIPNMLINRVDVVTGGASAAYGSDAVTGVVNFVLDETFKGIKVQAQAGLSDQGDAFNYRYGVAAGTSLGERVHLIASYEHYKASGLDLYDRDWAHGNPFLTSTTSGISVIPIGTANDATSGGAVTTSGLATFFPGFRRSRFTPTGTLVPFIEGTATANTQRNIGGEGATWAGLESTALMASLKTDQAFARGTFELTDNLQFYAQGSYARTQTDGKTTVSSNTAGNGARRAIIYADNPYLSGLTAAQKALIPAGGFTLGRQFTDLPLNTQDTTVKFRYIQAGFKGDFGNDWKWDVNYVNGRSVYDLVANELNSRNYFAAVDAVDAGQFTTGTPNGKIVCRVTLANPTFAAANGLTNCQPINIIGQGNVSPAAYAFVRQDSLSKIVNTMQYVNANLSGKLFTLPAGDLSFAVGAEYREQKLEQTSNSDPAPFSVAGYRNTYFGNTDPLCATTPSACSIRGVGSSSLAWLVTNVGLASGTQKVKEVYGELQVPLLSGQARKPSN